MLDIANTSIDIIILLLRVAVVLLLYFFLWQVLRFVVRDLQGATAVAAGAGQASPYGQLVVLRSGQSGVAAGKTFPLSPSTIIGRSMEQCEIALNDSFLSQPGSNCVATSGCSKISAPPTARSSTTSKCATPQSSKRATSCGWGESRCDWCADFVIYSTYQPPLHPMIPGA
jgi:hypothetical protein